MTDKDNSEQEIKKWMNYAAKVALSSVCQKSQRGAIVVRNNKLLGEAYNGPPFDKKCNPCLRMDIRDNTKFDLCYGVHAEERAVRSALAKAGNLEGSILYYIKTRNNKICPSETIACTQCSRIILDSGIAKVVMWRKETNQTTHYVIYPARKFNELALCYVKDKRHL